ncbi:hypothetical protein I317_05759 [Kwoniella heveanensis CBS 569]|nr:hypothetical protein I317_05759 [Kwoniella heveanensis CBS 569]
MDHPHQSTSLSDIPSYSPTTSAGAFYAHPPASGATYIRTAFEGPQTDSGGDTRINDASHVPNAGPTDGLSGANPRSSGSMTADRITVRSTWDELQRDNDTTAKAWMGRCAGAAVTKHTKESIQAVLDQDTGARPITHLESSQIGTRYALTPEEPDDCDQSTNDSGAHVSTPCRDFLIECFPRYQDIYHSNGGQGLLQAGETVARAILEDTVLTYDRRKRVNDARKQARSRLAGRKKAIGSDPDELNLTPTAHFADDWSGADPNQFEGSSHHEASALGSTAVGRRQMERSKPHPPVRNDSRINDWSLCDIVTTGLDNLEQVREQCGT